MSGESPLPYQSSNPNSRETRRLKLLASFHCVAAVLLLIEVPASFWCAYVFFKLSGPSPGKPSISEFIAVSEKNHWTEEFSNPWIIGFAALAAASGWMMAHRHYRIFSFVAGCVLCVWHFHLERSLDCRRSFG